MANKDNRDTYEPAAKGYLYYSVKPGSEDICKKEWADIKAVAGSGQIIGFSGRRQTTRLRKTTDKPADPDVYPLDHGITKLNGNLANYGPVKELMALPKE